MNTQQFAAALTFALVALATLPATAQQGPAGVPGAFEIIESVAPAFTPDPDPAPPAPDAIPRQPAAPRASTAVPSAAEPAAVKSAPANPVTSVTSVTSVTPVTPVTRADPGKPNAQTVETCSTAADAARCRLYEKARESCQALLGREHRQCLRDILAPGR